MYDNWKLANPPEDDNDDDGVYRCAECGMLHHEDEPGCEDIYLSDEPISFHGTEREDFHSDG